MRNKKILFTGGGSVGHVAPNLALMEELAGRGYQLCYLGSYRGIERALVTKLAIPYYPIITGKWRRYFSWKNFVDPFKFVFGIIQAWFRLISLRPQLVFSKGGFVALPVVVAAWVLRIPIIVHESDLTLGLANRWSLPFADKICITFPETKVKAEAERILLTGLPIRAGFFSASAAYGREFCGFHAEKPILMIWGGSLGSRKINQLVQKVLPALLQQFQVIHIGGQELVDTGVFDEEGYRAFSYVDEAFPHLLAAADLVITRAGANTVYELLTTRKLNILLPLAKGASRGDQVINAKYCYEQGYSEVIYAEQLNEANLLAKLTSLSCHRLQFEQHLQEFRPLPATVMISALIEQMIA